MTNSNESVVAVNSAWFIQGSIEVGGPRLRIPILCGRFQVGRRNDVHLCIPHGNVSKVHAEFVASETALFVRDMGSTNGTFVNGTRIIQDTVVGEGDVVQFADFEFVVSRKEVEQPLCTMVSAPKDWRNSIIKFHRLLTDRTIVPHFQPIIQFSDGKRVGYEVLARSPVEGLENPKELFSAAERAGLAARLSDICRDRGVEVASEFKNPGLLFLNTHPSERSNAGLIESLAKLRASAPEIDVVLELHEAAVTNPQEIAELRRELNELNIQLAYDDFGAGQARLMELSEVAPDFLKFDIGLIRDIHLVPQRQQFVAGLVKLVRQLGIQPLAEGIETAAEAEVCREIGFTHAQGYFYGKPVTVGLDAIVNKEETTIPDPLDRPGILFIC